MDTVLDNIHEAEFAKRPVSGPPNTVDQLEVVPTGAALGAEIRGIDFAKPVPDDVKQKLNELWFENLVLLFRDQSLSQTDVSNASNVFGPTQDAAAKQYFRDTDQKPLGDSEHPDINRLSNLGPDGTPVRENAGLGSLEVIWHSDNSYIETPPAGSMLYSRIIPPEGHGGETSFNNQYLAYETLPDDVKERIKDMKLVHDSTRNSAGVLRPGVKLPTKPSEVPGPTHPLVRLIRIRGARRCISAAAAFIRRAISSVFPIKRAKSFSIIFGNMPANPSLPGCITGKWMIC